MSRSNPQRQSDGNVNRTVQSDVRRLVQQFLILTLGGAIVSATFQYFGKIRDDNLQRQKFRKESFLAVREETNKLITERLLSMERIRLRLISKDFQGAEALKTTRYEEVVHSWNMNVVRLKGLILRFDNCDSPEGNQCAPAAGYKVAGLCARHLLYDNVGDENNLGKDGYVNNPRSVHFAFRNAGKTLTGLLESEWTECHERVTGYVRRLEEACRTNIAPGDADGLRQLEACAINVKNMLKAEHKRCEDKAGNKLVKQITEELDFVEKKWSELDKSMIVIGKALEGE